MTGPAPRRVAPLAPFLRVASFVMQRPLHVGQGRGCPYCPAGHGRDGTHCISGADIAEWSGFSTRAVSRWMVDGLVSVLVADRLATAIGEHPSAIWPDLFGVGLDEQLGAA